MENYFGPIRKEIVIMGRRGPSNPTPDNETDTYWIDDYWFAPAFFDIEFIGENDKWDDKFVEGEMGALKRYLLHMSVQGQKMDVDPFSVYVCIENLQRYYKRKIEECRKIRTTSSTPGSTTETP
jgi:hypothetical protein